MSLRFIATIVCSALSLMGATGFAAAETIGRFQCSVIDTPGIEKIDRPDHFLLNLQYSCFATDGLLKGDVHTASSVTEVDGAKLTFLRGGGLHRSAGGLAVTQITDSTGAAVMKDDKLVSTDSSGAGIFKFASGNWVALSGKSFKFTMKQTGLGRFDLEFTN